MSIISDKVNFLLNKYFFFDIFLENSLNNIKLHLLSRIIVFNFNQFQHGNFTKYPVQDPQDSTEAPHFKACVLECEQIPRQTPQT